MYLCVFWHTKMPATFGEVFFEAHQLLLPALSPLTSMQYDDTNYFVFCIIAIMLIVVIFECW